MKKITNTLFGASLLLAAVLGINSCQKPSGEGTGVRFRARTLSSPLTKTAYSGVVDNNNMERIDWRPNDEIRIACAQCTPTSADYRVTGTITSDGAISTANALTPVAGGLQWSTGPHKFYAVYPAGSAEVTAAGVASAAFPASQGGTDAATSSDTSTGVTTVTPDMSNAFMFASKIDYPGSNVKLTFYPMFTAFQFTVGGDGTGGDVTLKSVDLISTSCALSGGFSLNTGSGTYTTIPSVETEGESANNKITYTFPENTTINTNKKVCFTLFVQPSSNVTGNANHEGWSGVITDLTIRFTLGDGVTTRALKLKYADSSQYEGKFVDFPGGKKINITGLTLPTQLKSWSFTVLDVDDWDDDSPDILYGQPQVVEPGEGWIAETFAPDVSGLEGDHFYIFSPLVSFSVSATQKVRFSPGNLQYTMSAGIWSFMDHQYSTVETNGQDVGTNYANQDVVSLFGWGTSGHEFPAGTYGNAYQPWSTSTTDTDYGPIDGTSGLTGDYAEGDWGSAVASTLGSGWRTLTKDEWVWLLGPQSSPNPGTNCRTSSTVNETANARFAKANLFGTTHGLIIFPDSYTHPDGVAEPTGINATDNSSWNLNQYNATDWAKMESAGCVFLPAAGHRTGTSVSDVGFDGRYWSSTHYVSTYAYSLIFFGNTVYSATNYSQGNGCSVRLVQDL